MYRYKIVIADDERIVADTVKEILKKEIPDIEVVAVFYDGSSVLKYIQDNSVDIIISDICMPDATGMDIIRTVYEKKYNIDVILITGYEKFEYAKAAIDYHVRFFLTKPIDFNELIKHIETLVCERNSHLEHIYELESVKLHNHKIAREIFGLFYEGKYGFNQVLKIPTNENHSLNYSECNFTVKNFKWDKKLPYAGAITDICECVCPHYETYCIAEREKEAVVLYIYYEKDKQSIMTLAEEHKKMLQLIYSTDVQVVTRYDGKLFDYQPTGYSNLARQYFDALDFGNTHETEKIEKIFKEDFAIQELRVFIISLSEYVFDIFGVRVIENEDIAGTVNKEDFYKLLNRLSEYIASRKHCKTDKFDNILNYIRNDCSDDFSLVTIADKFGVSATYLSKTIKKRTGLKFHDFVFQNRIIKAKEMLKEGRTVSETAYAVGYSSKEYFSTVFKSATGISPKEYKERINRYEKDAEKT